MDIGKNIKAMRQSRQITQSELANKLNVSNKAISSWECDRTEPNMGMIEEMCKVFVCTKTELERQQAEPDTKKASALVESFGDAVTHGDDEQVRILVRALIDRIEIDGENVAIYWTFG